MSKSVIFLLFILIVIVINSMAAGNWSAMLAWSCVTFLVFITDEFDRELHDLKKKIQNKDKKD